MVKNRRYSSLTIKSLKIYRNISKTVVAKSPCVDYNTFKLLNKALLLFVLNNNK